MATFLENQDNDSRNAKLQASKPMSDVTVAVSTVILSVITAHIRITVYSRLRVNMEFCLFLN